MGGKTSKFKIVMVENHVQINRQFAASYLRESELCFQTKQYESVIYWGKEGLNIAKKSNDRQSGINACLLLANTYYSLNQYDDAIDYSKKCIDVAKETSDKQSEMNAYWLLGNCYFSLKKYKDAIDYSKTCIDIAKETGDKQSEMNAYLLNGKACNSLKQFCDAIEYSKKCTDIATETGDMKLEQRAYLLLVDSNLSNKSFEYSFISDTSRCLTLAEELQDKSSRELIFSRFYVFLDKSKDGWNSTGIHDLQTIATQKRNSHQATYIMQLTDIFELYHSCKFGGQYDEAVEYLGEVIELQSELGALSIFTKSFCHERIGRLCRELNKSEMAIKHLCLGLTDARDIDCKLMMFRCSQLLGLIHFEEGQIEDCISYLKEAITCIDFFVKPVHHVKTIESIIIDFFDSCDVVNCYKVLASSLVKKNQIQEALLVFEQRNARALKDRLSSKYGIKRKEFYEEHIQYFEIKSLVSNNNYSIVFFSVCRDCCHTFLLESEKDLQLQLSAPELHECHFDQYVETMFKELKVRHVVNCEDRSLDAMELKDNVIANKKSQCDGEHNLTKSNERLFKQPCFASHPRGDPSENSDESSMTSALEVLYHKLLDKISIEQDEVVFIPDGPLYKVPFAALQNPDTKLYLSETKRIRIAPSITTLKLLQEFPADYWCKKGALIVGDPLVGKVMFNGQEKEFPVLDNAFFEALAIGSILNVTPLTKDKATKPVVIEKLQQGVAVVHIAAHGDESKATIALAPSPETRAKKIPDEEDYMLTMADVQKAQVRAQLVVLSCCHSGRGEIRAEGVVGMCRAFLASGARAVVASLWAIDDEATYEFMTTFYLHLRDGKSASTSLQQTMKEMRNSPDYKEPKYWAPFFLMGDDVTLKF